MQEIARLREENDRLRKLLEEYAKRIADLERQLALKQQNSTITSKPPSSDGDQGERAVERLLTVARTCRLQQLNALVYLTAAIAAHRRRQAAPSLLKRSHTP